MTYLKASCFSLIFSKFKSVSKSLEKIKTPILPIKAAITPLPASKKPNAVPWFLFPPHRRVAFIIAPQNKKTVVIPQYAYKICKTKNEGNVAITNPPRAVVNSAMPINFPGANLSATRPPKKYDNRANIPYVENKLPNCKLVKLNASKNVGLNILAITYVKI